MDELEVKVAAPLASAEKLLSLVQEIASTHSDSSPEVSQALRARLQKIAEANGGPLPSHGRLYASQGRHVVGGWEQIISRWAKVPP